MYIDVTFRDFEKAFNELRPSAFNYEQLVALFKHLEELEEGMCKQIELDVIAICCNYIAYDSIEECLEENGFESIEELGNNTTIIECEDGSVIINAY